MFANLNFADMAKQVQEGAGKLAEQLDEGLDKLDDRLGALSSTVLAGAAREGLVKCRGHVKDVVNSVLWP